MSENIRGIKEILAGGGAWVASTVIPPPLGVYVGGILGGLVGEIIEEKATSFISSQQGVLWRKLRPLRNADLERAAITALRSALQAAKRELQKQTDNSNLPRGLSPEEEDLFREWDGQLKEILKMPDEQLMGDTPHLPSDAPTFTALTEETLADALLQQLSKLAESTTIPESLEHFLRAHLPAKFRTHYCELLKDPAYNRAWIAFQRQMLEAIFQAIGGLPGHICKLVEEQIIKKQEAILSLLEAEPERWEQRAEQLKQEIKQPILEAIEAMQQRLDYIVSLIGERHSYRLLHKQTHKYINFCMQEVFVGREEMLGNLEDFLAKRQAGIVVLIAPAGYGKTRLMMHLLARLQLRSDIKTVYHLFTNHEALKGLGTEVSYAYAHLLLQIGHLKGKPVHLPDDNPNELFAMLYYQIEELTESQKPLVILIDGLDEAKEPIHHLPLPDPLPKGVFVIVSARWDGQGEPPPYLEAWCQHASQVFSLETLTENDLREWLTREDRLRPYAKDDEFVRMLHQRTEGLPLHARYLIDDLKHADDPRQKLRDAPQGFSNYIDQQVRHLAQHVKAQEIEKMLALLTVAKGAVPKADLQKLCDLSNIDLMNLPQPIRRWFLVSEAGWQFTHPRLAAEFRRTLDTDANEMEEALLAYCARWREHRSPYALRYYAAHLAERAATDAAAAEQLYALMEDEEFLQAQRAAFPNQPELPLSVLRHAIEVAIQRDEPVPLARALLLHAQRVGETRLQSPYRIWRETGNLEHALKVADLYPPRVRPLWYLLLAREQPDREQRKDTLDRLAKQVLQEGAPSCLVEQRPYLDIACALLVALANDIDEAMFVRLKSLFSAQNWLHWVNQLVDAGYNALARQWLEWFHTHLELPVSLELVRTQARLGLYPHAIASAQRIEDDWWQSKALVAVAKAQAQAGLFEDARQTALSIKDDGWQSEALVAVAVAQAQARLTADAQQTFQQARRTAQRIADDWLQSEALAAVAKAQAQAGLFEDARQTALSIKDDGWQSEALVAVAVAQAQAGLTDDARQTFQQAYQIALRIGDDWWQQCEALVAVAEAQAQAGLFEDARQTALSIRDDWWQSEALVAVAVAQAQAGLTDDARQTFQQARQTALRIGDDWQQCKALAAVAKAQAQAGLFEDARQTALSIRDDWWQSEALVAVAVAQAQAGLFEDARQTALSIKDDGWQSEALVAVAEAQAQAGLTEGARQTFQQARQTALSIEDDWQQCKALVAVAKAQAQAGLTADAQQTFQQACHTALRIGDDWRQGAALVAVAEAQAQAGLFEDACQTALLIAENEAQSEALVAVAEAQAQAGLFEDTRQTALRIGDDRQQSEALVAVAEAQAQAGLTDDARQTFQQAYQIALRIGDDWWQQCEALVAVAEAQAQAGLTADAQQTFQQACQTAQRIAGDWYRSKALVAVAEAQAQAEQFEEAIRTAHRIYDPNYSLRLSLMQSLVEAGDRHYFKQLLPPAAHSLPASLKACAVLIHAYPDQAREISAEVMRAIGG